jgi:hypothetical protein
MYGLIRSQRRWPIYVDSFETLYDRYKESGCEDRRDCIFALLGIAKEVALERGFIVDYQKNMEETFVSLIAWGGTGAIAESSRIHFALLVAKAMNLEWPNHLLESSIDSTLRRSPYFSKWVHQPLLVVIPCRYLGNWTFQRHSKLGVAQISPELFEIEPLEVYLSLDAGRQFKDLSFHLFGFGNSNVVLACKANTHRSWTVATRAFYRFKKEPLQRLPNRNFVPSVFEELDIVVDESGRCRIELKNLAQFMELLLDELDTTVWQLPKNVGPRVEGAGSLKKPKNDNRNRGLDEVLERLKIVSSVTLAGEEEGSSEESDEDESPEADLDKLLAGSEDLARPRLKIPSLDKPRKQRSSSSNVSLHRHVSDKFLDPFCERTFEGENIQESMSSPPFTSSSVDFVQQLHLPFSSILTHLGKL